MPFWINIVLSYGNRHRIGCALFSFVAALSFAMASRICMPGVVTDSGVSIEPITISTVLVFIVSLVAVFLATAGLGSAAEFLSHSSNNQVFMGSLSDHRFVSVALLALCICWSPYLLACYPGGVFSDSFNAIRQAVWGGLNNQQPILYTLLLKLAIEASESAGHGLTIAIAGFCAVQYTALSFEAAVILKRLRSSCLPKTMVALAALSFAFFPLVPAYAVSIWKDVPFTLALIPFAIALYDASKAMLTEEGICWGIAVRLLISGLFVAFFRNNGKFILALGLVALLILILGRKAVTNKAAIASAAALLLATFVAFYVQGPIYTSLGLNDTETTESIAIPVQQIAAILVSDSNMTADERAYVDTFLQPDDAKEYYNPCLFDMIKWYAPSYNGAVIGSNMGKFIATWVCLVVKNPSVAFEAYILETCGFWAPNVATTDGYVSVKSWYNEFELENTDILDRLGVHGVSEVIQSLPPISAGIFAWIMLAFIAVGLMERMTDSLLGILPLFALWITVMIATPIAVSLRYVYAIVFAVPLEAYFVFDSRNHVINTEKR